MAVEGPIVDIHCHTFNADDLPVKGFVDKVAGNKQALARVLASAIDRIVQRMAVDAAEENRELDERLSRPPGGLESFPIDLESEVERDVADIIRDFDPSEMQDLAQAEAELSGPAEAGGLEGFGDLFEDAKRHLKWAALFGKRRYELTDAMIRTYPEVELFTPLLVDFQGLGDEPTTPIVLQLELQEKISRLSMRGDLGAAVHPFVGFDPRRPDAVRNARLGVESFGCVGVKMYPPMGFRPLGNAEQPPHLMTPEQAAAVDAALIDLYTWCEAEHVPITAHCNPSNYAHDRFEEFSHPDHWRRALDAHPQLRLNLGHFGWGSEDRTWTARICEMTNDFDHLYADIGNHEVEGLDQAFEHLVELFDPERVETAKAAERLMFGTDWFMVASHRRYEEFLTRFQEAYNKNFPAGLDGFMGRTALRFLGFDDPQNRNNQRLRARYAATDFTPPPWLAH